MPNVIGYRVCLHNKESYLYDLYKEQIEENEKDCFEDIPEDEWFDYRPYFVVESLDSIPSEEIYDLDTIYDD